MKELSKYRLCGAVNTTVSGKLLYLILSDLCDMDGEISLSQRKISEALRLSKGTVSRNLRRLERIGVIGILAQYNNYGGRAPNKYIVK